MPLLLGVVIIFAVALRVTNSISLSVMTVVVGVAAVAALVFVFASRNPATHSDPKLSESAESHLRELPTGNKQVWPPAPSSAQAWIDVGGRA